MTKNRAKKKSRVQVKQEPGTKRKRERDRDRDGEDDKESFTRSARAKKPKAKAETQDCDICAETVVVARNFKNFSRCDHEPTVCNSCCEKHFVTRIEADRYAGWHSCHCPLCGENIDREEARGVMGRKTAKRIEDLIKKSARTNADNWLYCPGPGCGHGQLYDPARKSRTPWVSCNKCRITICTNHQRVWHEGIRCEEFDSTGNHDEIAIKDTILVKRTTKACPHCQARIKKIGGCNHMRCGACNKQWLWDEVPFDGEDRGTTAEYVGGPDGHAPLGPEARQNVHQVMRAENTQVDLRNQVRQRPQQPNRGGLPVPFQLLRVTPKLGRTLQAQRNRISSDQRRPLQQIHDQRAISISPDPDKRTSESALFQRMVSPAAALLGASTGNLPEAQRTARLTVSTTVGNLGRTPKLTRARRPLRTPPRRTPRAQRRPIIKHAGETADLTEEDVVADSRKVDVIDLTGED